MEKDLTVDVGVLMAASGLGAREYQASSLALGQRIESISGWGLALDQRKRILQQYGEKMKQGTYGHALVILLISRNKVRWVPWKGLDRGIRTALSEAHFDREDYKYVETAAQSNCRVLVSHDDDYSPQVRRALGRVGVSVRTAGEVSEEATEPPGV